MNLTNIWSYSKQHTQSRRSSLNRYLSITRTLRDVEHYVLRTYLIYIIILNTISYLSYKDVYGFYWTEFWFYAPIVCVSRCNPLCSSPHLHAVMKKHYRTSVRGLGVKVVRMGFPSCKDPQASKHRHNLAQPSHKLLIETFQKSNGKTR